MLFEESVPVDPSVLSDEAAEPGEVSVPLLPVESVPDAPVEPNDDSEDP